mmetsp:Transcript_10579/g.28155  ORF Transcript_10579/g.28155 Transcript_10579/m.28155 type:complete len:267 (-) Transcript_10579:610-1410(-)
MANVHAALPMAIGRCTRAASGIEVTITRQQIHAAKVRRRAESTTPPITRISKRVVTHPTWVPRPSTPPSSLRPSHPATTAAAHLVRGVVPLPILRAAQRHLDRRRAAHLVVAHRLEQLDDGLGVGCRQAICLAECEEAPIASSARHARRHLAYHRVVHTRVEQMLAGRLPPLAIRLVRLLRHLGHHVVILAVGRAGAHPAPFGEGVGAVRQRLDGRWRRADIEPAIAGRLARHGAHLDFGRAVRGHGAVKGERVDALARRAQRAEH